MSLNLDRITDPEVRAQTLVFALTGLCEQAYRVLLAAQEEMGEFEDHDAHTEVREDTPEYRELFELLGNLEQQAGMTQWALGSLALRPQ